MKTRMQRWLARGALSLFASAAWGTGAAAQSLSGVYGGEDCEFKLTFRGMDVVYIQFIAGGSVMQELPGHYKVDGDRVSVTAPNWGAVFTRKGDTLKTPYLGGTAVCTKPPGVGSARPQVARPPIPMGLNSCDVFSWAYNRDNICFDTRPLLLTPTSKAKGSLGNMHSWSPQSQGALTLPWPADVSVTPWPVLLLLKVSRDGRTLEASGWYSSNVKTFTDAAVNMVMAKNLRWKPAQRNGEAVEALVLLEVQPVFAGASGFISVNVIGGDQIHNTVRIDRVFIGQPPVINYQVRAGPHTINVQITGPPYREVNDTVQVASGATVVKSYAADPLAPAPLPPKPKPIDEQQLVAAMKSDLRNLVTAEEGFFADSVHYTANVGRLQFRPTGDNTPPRVTVTTDGWSAVIDNPRTPTVCAIFLGSTPRPPAKLEGAPECVAQGVATYEERQREQAARTRLPSEFSDTTTSTKASSAAAGGERDTNASRGGHPNVGVEPPITPKPAPSSSELSSALLTAKAIVDGASYDSTRARRLQLSGDSATLAVLRAAYANRLDSARTYLAMALASPDTALRTSAAAILLQGGAKLGRANIWDHAYPWLDETLQLVVPRAPSDTTGPRQQIRIEASFWYGLSSVLTLKDQYRAIVSSRNCSDVLAMNDRIARTKEALMLGMRVHPPTVNEMLQNLAKFEHQMPTLKRAFACQNF